jgi:site-specific recombinase XerD
MSRPPRTLSFQQLLQDYFTLRLVQQRAASPRTIESYRDAFRLFLQFAERELKKSPATLAMRDVDAPLVLRFLEHLEEARGNRPRSRNARLAAIRSFMRYAAGRDTESLPSIQRVLAIPTKRFSRPLLGFLTREEMSAILGAPLRKTWSGERDHVLLSTLYNTGARVSELTALKLSDVDLERSQSIRVLGKGRKERQIPLWRETARALQRWLARLPAAADGPVFPNRSGGPISRSGVEQRLRCAVRIARSQCESLKTKRVSLHTFRHTTAMHLLQAGVELSVIALWLGHESPATTHQYLAADLAMKERALAAIEGPGATATRFKPGDRLLAFLNRL